VQKTATWKTLLTIALVFVGGMALVLASFAVFWLSLSRRVHAQALWVELALLVLLIVFPYFVSLSKITIISSIFCCPSGSECFPDAVIQVFLEDLMVDAAQNGLRGQNLVRDVNAVAILLHHADQTVQLPPAVFSNRITLSRSALTPLTLRSRTTS